MLLDLTSIKAHKAFGLAKIIGEINKKLCIQLWGNIDFHLYYWNQFGTVPSLQNNLWAWSWLSVSSSAGELINVIREIDSY